MCAHAGSCNGRYFGSGSAATGLKAFTGDSNSVVNVSCKSAGTIRHDDLGDAASTDAADSNAMAAYSDIAAGNSGPLMPACRC